IYNRALSASEVSNLAAGSQPATASATYTLNAALDVNGDLTLASGGIDTASASNFAINVAGSWLNYGGVFTPRSGTVTLDGTAAGKTLASGGQQFNSLTVSGSAGAWTLADSLHVADTYTQSAGTLNTDSTNNWSVTADDFDQTAGTFTANSSTLTLDSPDAETVNFTSSQYNVEVGDTTETGLVGYWKFDEGSGTSAADSSGNGNTGTLTFGPTWTTTTPVNPGPTFNNPYALDFDGVDDYVVINDSPSLDTPDAFTVAAWIFDKNDGTTHDSINKDDGFSGSSWRIRRISDTFGAYKIWNSSNAWKELLLSNSWKVNEWFFMTFVASVDGSTINLEVFINGTSVGTGSFAGSAINTSDGDVHIGVDAPVNNKFKAQRVDDVRIYNRALSASEVSNLAAGNPSPNASATYTLNTSLDVNASLSIQSGVLAAGSNNITVGSEFLNTAGSSGFSAGTSTLTMDAASGTKDIQTGGASLYNLTLNDGGGTATFELEGALDVNNNLTITGGTLDVKSGENNSITVGGNFTNLDTFTARSGSVTFDATDTGNTFNPGASSFYGVTFNGSGGAWDLTSNALDIDNTLTITNGIFDLNGQNLTATGATFSNSGTLGLQGGETLTGFTNDTDSGTVAYDGTTSYASLAAGQNYHALTFNGSGGSWTITSALDVNNNLTITAGTYVD
ncbi:MAG: LamG-like jellyroll fold domain-containing protein, partial [Candidatus Binatia bacterium]